MEWISVDDRLPKESMPCLGWNGKVLLPVRWLADKNVFSVGIGFTAIAAESISHWMPLPTPPEDQP
jgi:hypothetical protein